MIIKNYQVLCNGIITGTIEERDLWLNTIGSQSEDEIKKNSLKYHDNRLLPGDIWDKNILLSDLLLILSRNINIYSDSTPKIPKIYFLSFCRSGNDRFAAELIKKCLKEQSPDEPEDFEPASPFTLSKI